MNNITFRKCLLSDEKLLKQWFNRPHAQEFWDTTPEMWENVESYLHGKKILFDYWLGDYEGKPFCLVITSDAAEPAPGETVTEDHTTKWQEAKGITLTVDFMIGEEVFLGKGLAAVALKKFAEAQDSSVSALLIDPDVNNEKAVRAYERAGFVKVCTFSRKKNCFGVEQPDHQNYLMKMKL